MSLENELESLTNQSKAIIGAKNLASLPGVGTAIAKKLYDVGFQSLDSIATVPTYELAALGNMGEKAADKIIRAARKTLGYGFVTADVVLETRHTMAKLTTGSNALDDLIGGGIETGCITEIYGEFRTGKTQLAHQLCVTSQLPIENGGFQLADSSPISCAYIDTEGTFRPERIIDMAVRYSNVLDIKSVLKNIVHGRAYSSDHQIALVENILHDFSNIKLVIIDSLIAHFRAEYTGRGTLSERQQKLNRHLHSLLRLAEIAKAAIILTNQVHSQPDIFFGDAIMPVGGHILAHTSHTRIYLRKSKGERRIARIVDSPFLPETETVFQINKDGIVDVM